MTKSRGGKQKTVVPLPAFSKAAQLEALLAPKPGTRINKALLNKELLNAAAAGIDVHYYMALGITNAIVARVQAGMQPKWPNAVAIGQWRSKLQAAVLLHLQNNGDWARDGANVLQVAFDMGAIAGLVCGSPGVGGEANIDQLKASFAVAKTHVTCSSAGGSGGGAWCTFDWF